MFLTRFTVIDEISRVDEIHNNVEIKFNLLNDAGIMVLTAVFQATYKTAKNITLFGISLILSKTQLTVGFYFVANLLILAYFFFIRNTCP